MSASELSPPDARVTVTRPRLVEQPPPARVPLPAVRKRRVLGVPLAMTDYEGAMDVMDALIARRERGYVCAVATHAVMVAQEDPDTRAALLGATLTVPDGMPLVWAANRMGERLADRVYGPSLMDLHCARAAWKGHRVWLYGGKDEAAVAELAGALLRRHPELQIVGSSPAPFHELGPEHDSSVIARMNADGPDVVWVGTGAPRQEKWMHSARPRIEAPVLCGVGAAFDFFAGRVPQAPSWMQQRGLEWLYRTLQEPRRLAPRYLRYNPRFVLAVARQLLRERT